MNKLFKKVLAGVLACSMLGSMSAVALAAENTVGITKVEVLSGADDENPTVYAGDSLNNAKLSAGQLIRVTAKTTNSNTSPYLTFLSYKEGNEAGLSNTTVQYVAQDAATNGTEQTFTFRPRTTVGAGKYTAKVGATGVANPVSITYTVNATMSITAPTTMISFATNTPPTEGIKFDFTSDGTIFDDEFTTGAEVYIDDAKLVDENYTFTKNGSGSSATTGDVTIKQAGLQNLSVGNHKVTIKYTGFEDAVLENAFTVTGQVYNVTLNVDGGEDLADGAGSFTADKVGTELPTPTKAHKTFGGWYAQDDTTYANKIEKYATDLDGKTLVAKWNDITHTIQWKNTEGATLPEGVTLPTSYVEGVGINMNNLTLTKTGYTFAGWYLDDGVWSSVVDIDEDATENIIAYAKLTANTYTFKYMSNGKEYTEEGKANYTYGSDFTFPTPTGSEYVPTEEPNFIGWYTDEACSDGKQVGNAMEAVAGKDNGAEITLYANWAASLRYTLTLNYREKTNTVLSGIAGEVVPNITTYKDDNYSADGYDYTFVGWATTQDATEAISDTDLAAMTFPEGESNLYPVFSKNPIVYTVTFDAKDGSVPTASDNKISYSVATETKGLPTAIRDGYTFAGWYTNAEYTGEVVENWSLALGTTTLYAKWTQDWTDVEQLSGGTDVKVTKLGNIYKVTKLTTDNAKIDDYMGYAVVYKADGTLKSVTLTKAENTNEFTVTLPTTDSEETAKLFIWNKTNAKPVINTVVSGN